MNSLEIIGIKEKIKTLAEKYGLSLVVLFGSQATGRTHPKSDIDIAVLGDGKVDKFKLLDEFDKIFGREDIELVDMGAASPTMMRVLVEEGKLLYEKTSDTFFEWKLYAMWLWRDTAWLRELRDRQAVQWARSVK